MHLNNSGVASPVAMAGLSDGASGQLNLFSAEKFADRRAFRVSARQRETGRFFTGLDDVADDGKSSDVSRYRDSSKMNVVPSEVSLAFALARPQPDRFVRCRGGSRGADPPAQRQAGNVGYQFSAVPMKKAILRASSVRNSRARSGGGSWRLLVFLHCSAVLTPLA
jgi:hypothetical protein